jgi:hypothetical protein
MDTHPDSSDPPETKSCSHSVQVPADAVMKAAGVTPILGAYHQPGSSDVGQQLGR